MPAILESGARRLQGFGTRGRSPAARYPGQPDARAAGQRRVYFCGLKEPTRMPSDRCDCSRRQVVRSLFTGSMLFPAVLQQLFADTGDSIAPRAPHFPAKAKRVIFMYMPGGVSHVDSFDYKPKLIAAAEAKEVYK